MPAANSLICWAIRAATIGKMPRIAAAFVEMLGTDYGTLGRASLSLASRINRMSAIETGLRGAKK